MMYLLLQVMRLNRIMDEHIKGTVDACWFGDNVGEAKLRWFGCVERKDEEYVGRRILEMDPLGRRKRRSNRLQDAMKEDIVIGG